MLFKQKTLQQIKDGSVSLAFRIWKRPTVKEGGTLITRAGQLRIKSLMITSFRSISSIDLKAAGFSNMDELRKAFPKNVSGDLYRIEFELIGPDPRIELRKKSDLNAEDIEILKKKLARLDQYSKQGPWTKKFLSVIHHHPGVRAQNLADQLGVEKDWFKPNVRKLKKLGLTESLSVGYRISPRGEALLKHL
ncbi:MAG: ASCH domain-containing protein [Saprospiraceae bacterium]|nr:ASCH domain-containing protein [Saprospiraceae bacterium]